MELINYCLCIGNIVVRYKFFLLVLNFVFSLLIECKSVLIAYLLDASVVIMAVVNMVIIFRNISYKALTVVVCPLFLISHLSF